MLQSYKHFFNYPPILLNYVKLNGFVSIFGAQNPAHWTQFEPIVAVNNLTKLHLSMSKSWLTPDSFFLRKSLEEISTESVSSNGLHLTNVKTSLAAGFGLHHWSWSDGGF